MRRHVVVPRFMAGARLMNIIGSSSSIRPILLPCSPVLHAASFSFYSSSSSPPEKLPSCMRGVRLVSFGEPASSLKLCEDLRVPILNPATNDVLVRVEASSVNPIDLAIRRGFLRNLLFRARSKETNPMTLGFDCVGMVVQTGSRVRDFKVGDRVWARTSLFRDGSNADYVLVEEPALARAPERLSSLEAVSLPFVALNGWKALESGEVKPPLPPSHKSKAAWQRKHVLVIDNGSGVGAIVLQLAKHWGHLASATCSAANVPRLAQILASANARSEAPSEPTTEEKPVDEKVVDYEGNPKWDLQLNAQGKGFDVVIDTVGSQETEAKSLSLLNCSGHYISLHSLLLDSIHENGLFMGTLKGLWRQVKKFASLVQKEQIYKSLVFSPDGKVLEKVRQLVEDGTIRPPGEYREFSLDQVAEAHAFLESHRDHGKVVIKVQKDPPPVNNHP